MKFVLNISIETPGAVTYSTPRAEDDCFPKIDCVDEISERILGLEVSQFLGNSSVNPRFPHHSSHNPFLDPSDHVDAQPNINDRLFNRDACTDLSPSTSRGRRVQPSSKLGLSAPNIGNIQTCEVLDDNNKDSSHIALNFLEAVEMQAQLKLQEGGDNIAVYQKLSQLAEYKRLENRFDLYVALCSLVVMGYKKWLGLKERGALMTLEILADALKRTGNDNEALDLYQQAIEGYDEILIFAIQNVCRTSGPRHIHSPSSNRYKFSCTRERWSYDHRVSRIECILVNYYAAELTSGETQSYNEVVDLLSHLRALYDKVKSSERSKWPEHYSRFLDLYQEKREYKDKETYFLKIAQNAMEIAMCYRRHSPGVVDLLFPPVLARFKTLQPLPPVWSSWEIYFYGIYAYTFESDLLSSGKHLISAIEKFLRREGIDGLGDSLGLLLSAKLFRYREALEKEIADNTSQILEVELEASKSESDNGIDFVRLAKRALSPSVLRTPGQEPIRSNSKEDGSTMLGRPQKCHAANSIKNVIRGVQPMELPLREREISDMLMEIARLEDFVAKCVSSDRQCTLCFGNCMCKGDQWYEPPDLPKPGPSPADHGLKQMEFMEFMEKDLFNPERLSEAYREEN